MVSVIEPLGRGVLDQEGILAVSLVRQAAAARLLPGELLVEHQDIQTGGRQLFRGECSRRTATQDRDTLHFF